MERDMLMVGLRPGLPCQDDADASPEEGLAVDNLERRGCVRIVAANDCETWLTTPRGRLAIACDAAVRAVLV